MRLVLFIFRATVFAGLLVVALSVVLSTRLNRGPIQEEAGGTALVSLGGGSGTVWLEREVASKRRVVASAPSLGVPGNALREEFDRRARLFREYNPEFFNAPDWPERLWDLMARDLSLQDSRAEYPWKRDGMRVARP
jgi:hypothetical protein